MLIIHRKNIFLRTNYDDHGYCQDNRPIIFSFASFHDRNKHQHRDPSLTLGFCHLPTFSITNVECRIMLPGKIIQIQPIDNNDDNGIHFDLIPNPHPDMVLRYQLFYNNFLVKYMLYVSYGFEKFGISKLRSDIGMEWKDGKIHLPTISIDN